MKNVTVQDLLSIPALKDVPEYQLQWLIDQSEHYVLQAGEFLGKPGEELRGTQFIVSGSIELYRIQNNSKLSIAQLTAGTITGTLPFSRAKVVIANVQCLEETQVMTFPKEKLREMIMLHY